MELDELTKQSRITNRQNHKLPHTHCNRTCLIVQLSSFPAFPSNSLLTFTISFTLFRRQWKRLFLHPQRFFTSSQGHFIHILDGAEDPPPIDNNSLFLYLTKNEFLAKQGLAKETLQMELSLKLQFRYNSTQHPSSNLS